MLGMLAQPVRVTCGPGNRRGHSCSVAWLHAEASPGPLCAGEAPAPQLEHSSGRRGLEGWREAARGLQVLLTSSNEMAVSTWAPLTSPQGSGWA